jgi:hypothetical protein
MQLREAEDSADEKWWQEASIMADQVSTDTPASDRALIPKTADVIDTPTAKGALVPQTHGLIHSADQDRLPFIPKADDVPHVPAPFGGALISLGQNTDTVLDRFYFPDTLVLRLRELTTSVRSSK